MSPLRFYAASFIHKSESFGKFGRWGKNHSKKPKIHEPQPLILYQITPLCVKKNLFGIWSYMEL